MKKNIQTTIAAQTILFICLTAPPALAVETTSMFNRLTEMIFWLVIIAALTIFGIVLLKRQKQVEERKAHREIRVLMETVGQTEEMWQEKCEDLEKWVKKELADREKILKNEFQLQVDRYTSEINKLRTQNVELKDSMGQLMQALKKK